MCPGGWDAGSNASWEFFAGGNVMVNLGCQLAGTYNHRGNKCPGVYLLGAGVEIGSEDPP